jgi:iron complex transport system substrate-binding protein
MHRSAIAVLLVLAALLLGACGDDDSADSDASAAPAAETTAAAAATFPVTVEHKFGSTTVEQEPKRIVSVGLTEQDTILALGYTPIATTEWYGEHPYAVWPWAKELLGEAKPTVLKTTDGFDFEKIAGLRPDLIVGTNAGMKKADYEKLSALAPVIAPVKGATDYFSRWDEQVVQIAKGLGVEAKGQQLVDDTKAAFAEAAAEHPEFAGKTVTFAQNAFYDGLLYVYPPGLNTEFLEYLGFTINPKLKSPRPGEQQAVSAEKLGVIDADVIVFATESAKDIPALEKVPTFEKLEAVSENRSVYTDGTLAGAAYFMTPPSLQYVLEHLTPQLAAAS